MAQNQGTVPIRGTSATVGSPITFTILGPGGTAPIASGYVTPIVSGITITHQGSSDTVLNGDGEIVGVGAWGEYFEATFTLIPVGASEAAARLSATLPPLMSTVEIAAADPIQAGSVSSIIVASGTSRWLYVGGGSLSLSQDGQATMTLPLRRYPSVSTANSAIAT